MAQKAIPQVIFSVMGTKEIEQPHSKAEVRPRQSKGFMILPNEYDNVRRQGQLEDAEMTCFSVDQSGG